jgi:hypothetical protein
MRIGIRDLRLIAFTALLVGAALVWWAWSPHRGTSETNPLRSIASEPKGSAKSAAIAEPSDTTPAAGNKASATLSHEESKWIEAHIEKARSLVWKIQGEFTRPGRVAETDVLRSEAIHVPALTAEVLEPVYDALSRASKDLPADSAVAKAFRNRADWLLRDWRSVGAKYVRRSVDKLKGETSYVVSCLSLETTVTEAEDGTVSLNGFSSTRRVEGRDEHFDYLISRAFMLVK